MYPTQPLWETHVSSGKGSPPTQGGYRASLEGKLGCRGVAAWKSPKPALPLSEGILTYLPQVPDAWPVPGAGLHLTQTRCLWAHLTSLIPTSKQGATQGCSPALLCSRSHLYPQHRQGEPWNWGRRGGGKGLPRHPGRDPGRGALSIWEQ